MGERVGTPPTPVDELQRLESLHALGLIEAEGGERFDRITRLVQRILGVPIASLTLVDTDVQWFRSLQGLDPGEGHIPREYSFCAHAVAADEMLEVQDASTDPRFADNPLVTEDPSLRFYAGAPIHAPDGHPIGSLCGLDRKPRALSAEDRAALDDLAALAEKEIASASLAITDELTGLANRRGLALLAAQALETAQRMTFPVECLFVDVDGLKTVNDSEGHDAGDALIRAAAQTLARTFRGSDIVARIGGDEFCALLTGASAAGGDVAAERLRAAVARRNEATPDAQPLRLSIGHVGYPADVDRDLDTMLAKADAAMYEDKRARRAGRA